MVVEVAKWAYPNEHPERKRSPRGFTSGISLKITGVDEGSAIPVIALFTAAAAGFFPEQNQVYFEQARDRVVSAINAAEHNEPITQHLPESLLAYFDHVGRSLRENESIESVRVIPAGPPGLRGQLAASCCSRPAMYTKSRRRWYSGARSRKPIRTP